MADDAAIKLKSAKTLATPVDARQLRPPQFHKPMSNVSQIEKMSDIVAGFSRNSTGSDIAFEQHFSVNQLAERWNLSRETVRKAVKDEPDVIKVHFGTKKALTRYTIPASVARRIHTKLLNPLG